MQILWKIFQFLASFGLAVVCLLTMLLLVFLGTLYQVDHGLYEAQQKYFNSLFLIQPIGPIAVPLPGGYLVMAVFTLNIICGGLIRIRKNWRTPGILIAHSGIVFMLFAGFVTYHFSTLGYMKLHETEISDEYESFNHWNIEVGKTAPGAELHVIPEDDFKHLRGNRERTFHAEDLPFDVIVSDYSVNAFPEPGSPAVDPARVIDGFALRPMPREKEREANFPGVYVTVKDKNTGDEQRGLLWGLAEHPWVIESGGEQYALQLGHERWRVPFAVRLDTFTPEFHPGTQLAASYESKVTRIEDGHEEKVRIWMNHPLRRHGFTFFQASWGQERDGSLFSQFQVVRNPADQWPLYACLVIAFGLLVHFLQKLVLYMRLESKRRPA